mgnify:CR=1 FL=1
MSIEISQVNKNFGDFVALDDSFDKAVDADLARRRLQSERPALISIDRQRDAVLPPGRERYAEDAEDRSARPAQQVPPPGQHDGLRHLADQSGDVVDQVVTHAAATSRR